MFQLYERFLSYNIKLSHLIRRLPIVLHTALQYRQKNMCGIHNYITVEWMLYGIPHCATATYMLCCTPRFITAEKTKTLKYGLQAHLERSQWTLSNPEITQIKLFTADAHLYLAILSELSNQPLPLTKCSYLFSYFRYTVR